MCINKSVLYIAILSVCGICSYPILVSTGSSNKLSGGTLCRNALEGQSISDDTKSIVKECLSLNPLKDPNESSTIEEGERILEENQSNCALKCINENLNVTNEEGFIDVSRIEEVFLHTVNVSRAYILKLSAIMSDCEHKAGEQVQMDGRFEQNMCKYHVLFMHCYSDAYLASLDQLYQLCQESDYTEDGD